MLCPICQATSAHLHGLTFSKRMDLPQTIALQVCASCNFAFNTPRETAVYDAFYAANTNDILGADTSLKESEIIRYNAQLELLKPALDAPNVQRVLDIGCGQAGLLRTIKKHYPDKVCHAADPNVSASLVFDNGLVYSRTWQDLDQEFDLIILSHVAEHILDLQEFGALTRLLAPRGKVYIEVPDASRYHAFPRREYLYYFDRLHVNHFTPQSLYQLLENWGLHTEACGRNDFEYKDAKPYPAHYALASREAVQLCATQQGEALHNSLVSYIANEAARQKHLNNALQGKPDIVVYGFGDNFFKARGAGGALDGLGITAIVDARHEALSKSDYAKHYVFLGLDACCTRYPDATYVVTVSWGSAQIRADLQSRGIHHILEV